MENDKQPLIDEIDGVAVQIDPETGEVLGLPDAPADPSLVLGRLARAIAWSHKRIDALTKEMDDQVSITARPFTTAITKTQDRIKGMESYAQRLMEQAVIEKSRHPGSGTFGYYKKPDRIDDTAWHELDEDVQNRIMLSNRDLFTVKVQPDRAAIKAKLKEGVTVDGFAIEGGEREFKFRKES